MSDKQAKGLPAPAAAKGKPAPPGVSVTLDEFDAVGKVLKELLRGSGLTIHLETALGKKGEQCDPRVTLSLAPTVPEREAVLKTFLDLLRTCKAPKVTIEDETCTATIQVPPKLED